jgi:hypothetical protein
MYKTVVICIALIISFNLIFGLNVKAQDSSAPIVSVDAPSEVEVGKKFSVKVDTSDSATIRVYIANTDGSNKIFIGDRECWDGASTYHIECKITDEDIDHGSGDYQLILEAHDGGSESVNIKLKDPNVSIAGVELSSENLFFYVSIILAIIVILFIIVILILISKIKKQPDGVYGGTQQPGQRPPPCPQCRSGLEYEQKYNQWYCRTCNKYM